MVNKGEMRATCFVHQEVVDDVTGVMEIGRNENRVDVMKAGEDRSNYPQVHPHPRPLGLTLVCQASPAALSLLSK